MKGKTTDQKRFHKDLQYYKFCAYGFLKNLKFFDPFIFLFLLQNGINYVEIGILFSFREIGTNILEIPTGIFADSFGRKKSMILSFVSYIASFLVFFFFSNFYIFLSAMAFFSMGEAFRTGTHKAMILRYLEIKNITRHKVHYYGHTRGASQTGSALSSLIAMLLVFYTGSYKVIFIGSVIPYALGLVLLISYPQELDSHLNPLRGRFWRESRQRLAKTFQETWEGFKTSGELVKGIFSFGVFSGLFKGIKDYLQPVIKGYALALPFLIGWEQKEKTSVLIGLVYFITYLVTSWVSRRAGHFDQRFKKPYMSINHTYIYGTLCLVASGIFMLLKIHEIAIILFLSIHPVESLRKPLQVGFVSDKVNSKVMATALSAVSQIKTIAVIIISMLTGILAQVVGIGHALLIVSLLVLILYPLVQLKEKNQS